MYQCVVPSIFNKNYIVNFIFRAIMMSSGGIQSGVSVDCLHNDGSAPRPGQVSFVQCNWSSRWPHLRRHGSGHRLCLQCHGKENNLFT